MQKRKVFSLEWKSEGVMDDESGELMELVEEVPLKKLTDAKVERLVRGYDTIRDAILTCARKPT